MGALKPWHIVVLVVLVLLLFGAGKLPSLARNLGKSMRIFKSEVEEMKKDGKEVREWNDDTFGVFPLPGNDGKPAPVFAGGSNIAISAKSKNPELSKELMKIIFSSEYQQMLGKNGLGPANSEYVSALGDDKFAQTMIDTAAASKLTPAAPIEASITVSRRTMMTTEAALTPGCAGLLAPAKP